MNNSRAILVILFLLIGMGILASKLFTIQVSMHEEYLAKANRQQNKKQIVEPERGSIVDRNKNVLTYTKDDISFFADVRMLSEKNKKRIADRFASVFNKDAGYYLDKMNTSKGNVELEKKTSRSKANKLRDFVVGGLFNTQDFTRIYPYNKLASHVLGYVDEHSNGIAGVEKVFDEYLKGEKGILMLERDVAGRTVSVDDENSQSVINGGTIQLTLNKTYQKILEDEIIDAVDIYGGESAVGIIMNPNNGEILALTNLPDFVPQSYGDFSNEELRNRALTDTYEPGSTFKSLVMSILLDKNLVRESQVINTENGSFKFKTARIRDTHKHESLTVRGIIEQSSNIGMVKLVDRVDNESYYKYLRNFGFGNVTSIELPGEADGYLKKPNEYSGISKQFIAQGYEVSVTPLQMITAYSAIINGGDLYKPLLVKNILNSNDKIVESFNPRKIRRVVSKETSAKIKEFMYGVVENGTAKIAQIKNIEVGGKTGTAERLVNGSYSHSEHNASFIGFFPVDNPQIVCLILVSSPKKSRYGGTVAAPIFKNIAERIIEADPEIIPEDQRNKIPRNSIKKFFTNLEKEEISETIYSNYAEEKPEPKIKKKTVAKNVMPDLKKLSKRDAISKLIEFGLKYKIVGNGNVVSQSIKAGNKVRPGLICYIKCSSKNLNSLRIN
ncbi:MAG: transpeptidase family protein [Melioribacteraceae bacterium]|nr:transpeptidase family protein [Melioribacteraceae bacterium]